jgi:Uma2 family endonuclease
MTLAADPRSSYVRPQLGDPETGLARPTAPASAEGPMPRKWTRDEYYEMARLGFFRGRRVFLLGGEIFEMAGQGNWHSVTIGLVQDGLEPAFPRGKYWTRTQMPLDLPEASEPEPDVAIVPGKPADYAAHPTTALLVVEVADTSLRIDRRKANVYAAGGIQEYWIADIVGQQLEVYRNPVADPREPFGHRYDQFEVLRPGATMSPLAASGVIVAVADLLPKQPVPNPDA